MNTNLRQFAALVFSRFLKNPILLKDSGLSLPLPPPLRGPAAILFISCDTCSYSIEKLFCLGGPNALLLRKILVSVKFVSAILGPEMGAPILWTPGKNAFFLQEKPCP